MRRKARILSLASMFPLAVLACCSADARAQSAQSEPQIGYVYPAGARRGETVEVLIGGQHLRGVRKVLITGEGVKATVIDYYRPVVNLDKEQREELQRRMRETFEKRLQEMAARGERLTPAGEALVREWRSRFKPRAAKKMDGQTSRPVALPAHPLLRHFEEKDLRELLHIREEFLNRSRRQPNPQIAESVLIEMTVDRGAPPGDREIRLLTPLGLTNPMRFQVDLLREVREQEPNDPNPVVLLAEPEALDLPIIMNGQISPGDVDQFRIRATKGQNLVVDVRARYLVPYLADAVPGWFQAVLALYDEQGEEVAYADDYRFSPDPVLHYRVPADGTYELEIRDAIYRGREDFIYRITAGSQPFVTGVYPLGGRSGTKTLAAIEGWNLPVGRMRLDTTPGDDEIRHASVRRSHWVSRPVPFAVDTLPECVEQEPNNTPDGAQVIHPPCMINGHVGKPGDMDIYQFEGRAGDTIVAEVFARRLDSPLDSLLRLMDASGAVMAWNDDHPDVQCGLCTHHADSYLSARLPADGLYCIQLSDALRHGGQGYGYRLRVGPPQPDFALRVTPSSLNLRPRRASVISVHVARKDGFDGPIDLLLKDPPTGFSLQGGRIPAGVDRVRMTVTAPGRPLDDPVPLRLEGVATIGGERITHPAVPAEDMMQAFAYRHLVPSEDLMVATGGRWAGPPIALVDAGPFLVPLGGSMRIRMFVAGRQAIEGGSLELHDPPQGVTLGDVSQSPQGLVFELKADGETVRPELADNLIVEAFRENTARGRNTGKPSRNRRVSLGILPAIPIIIVEQ